MARSPEQIQTELIKAKEANPDLAGLDSTSKVAIWRLITNVVSFAIFSLEKIFDLHRAEVEEKISQLKPHTLRWYRQKALDFQSGFSLVTDADYFDNTGHDAQTIERSKIVKYAAVTEAQDNGRLIIKIATETGGKLGPINDGQKKSFEAYLAEIKDAGISVTTTNYLPDKLSLSIQIYRDPLVLDSNGNSILSGGKPVEEAIKQYLRELPFNGELILAHLVDRLQQVPGVKIPHIEGAQSKWITKEPNEYGPMKEFNVRQIPESGYFEVENFNGLSYVV